ncbi:hypothetical protein [Cobetia crustatorum]|uniref:DUF2570 domain-containing protein n=1 Tax=Cobetia crustatorum TaxID=553385 RepID=A0A558HG10_9GAMM|nr:hypothetical protein [Cobetia crustatorum]TVU68075.1 hypothetical protein FQP86_14890 [Cobetia crustatorum]
MAALILTAWSWARRLAAALPFEAILMAAVLAWGGMQTFKATRADNRADDLRAELSTEQAVNAGLEQVVYYYGDQMRRLSTALEAREASRAIDDKSIAVARAAARQLERDNASTADWAGRPVPDAAAKWLRSLREQDGNATH